MVSVPNQGKTDSSDDLDRRLTCALVLEQLNILPDQIDNHVLE